VGEELKPKRTARNKRHDKTKLTVLKQQRWWERSLNRKEPRETKDTIREAQYTRTPTLGGEVLKKSKTSGRKEKSNV